MLAVAVLSVTLCLTPYVLFKTSFQSGDFISPDRAYSNCTFDDHTECFNQLSDLTANSAGSRYNLSSRVHLTHLFSHLDKLNHYNDSNVFIPIIAFMFIVLGVFHRLSKTSLSVFITFFILLLIALGVDTPVYPLLFETIPYFKFFRHLYMFIGFLIPLIIVFALLQLQTTLSIELNNRRQRIRWFVLISCAHALLTLFLFTQGHILPSAYITIGLSWLLFSAFVLIHKTINRHLLWGGLVIIGLIQPLHVFSHYVDNANLSGCELPMNSVRPEFLHTRSGPHLPIGGCNHFRGSPNPYYDYWNLMTMRDLFLPLSGYPPIMNRWAFLIQQGVDPMAFLEAIRHRFVGYQNVVEMNDPDLALQHIQSTFDQHAAVAVISGQSSEQASSLSGINEKILFTPDQLIIEEHSVNHHTLRLQTNDNILLTVYEPYHPYWNAYLDGQSVPIIRTNLAFRGVFVPQGNHQLIFRYQPPMGTWIYGAIMTWYCCLLILTIAYYRKHP
jgi:hypothetical protein